MINIDSIRIGIIRTDYPAHSHLKMFEIHFFIDGNGTFINGRNKFIIAKNKFFLSYPQENHELLCSKNESILFYYLRFYIDEKQKKLIDQINELIIKNQGLYLTNSYRLFFEDLKNKFNNSNEYNKQSAHHLFNSFLYDLVTKNIKEEKGDYIKDALILMQNSIDKCLSLDDFAEELKINKYHFNRIFKNKIGIAPIKYFIKLKIEAACFLLKETNMLVYEISDYLKFYDEFHFSKIFKKNTGISPKNYRGKNLKKSV